MTRKHIEWFRSILRSIGLVIWLRIYSVVAMIALDIKKNGKGNELNGWGHNKKHWIGIIIWLLLTSSLHFI